MVWTLQDAKNKLSEVVEKARTEGPQRVTKHGKDAVVIISVQDWAKLQQKDISVADFLLSSPLSASGLEVSRDPSPLRPVEL